MKILLIGTYLPDSQHSMVGFSRMLESELMRSGHETRVIRPDVRLGRLGRPATEYGKWLGYVDKFVLFPARLHKAAQWADVAHICDHGYSLYTKYLQAIPHVVTCHDLIALRGALGEFSDIRTRWSGRAYQQMILRGLRRAVHVACVSETTRCDLKRLSGEPRPATSVVPNALNFDYKRVGEAERARRLCRFGIRPAERFILNVGSSAWYKNQTGVVRIFKAVAARSQARNLGLVMVTNGATANLMKLIRACGLDARVRVLSDLQPEDLRALYSAAEALLFPSLYEGFGWPIIEAQSCGCPVFTSNRPPMTEVGGDGAFFLDPENPVEAGNTIIENLPHAPRMREAGFVNAQRYSADKMVEGYVRAYAEARRSVAVATA